MRLCWGSSNSVMGGELMVRYRSTGAIRIWRKDHYGNMWTKVSYTLGVFVVFVLACMTGITRSLHWTLLLLHPFRWHISPC